MLETTVPTIGSWAFIQVIWSLHASRWQVRTSNGQKSRNFPALLFQGDCLPPKHLHSNYFRPFLTKDRVLEIKCLQSHECKSHQQRILGNYTEQHKWFRNLGQSVNEEFRKLVELKPPRLSITHWALLSCLPVYFSWHLCLPVNLTLPPPTPSTGPSDTHVSPDNALTSSASLNFPFELWLCLTASSQGPLTSSPGSRVPLKLDTASSPVSICCLTESCLS